MPEHKSKIKQIILAKKQLSLGLNFFTIFIDLPIQNHFNK